MATNRHRKFTEGEVLAIVGYLSGEFQQLVSLGPEHLVAATETAMDAIMPPLEYDGELSLETGRRLGQ